MLNCSVLCSGSVTQACVSRSGATARGSNTNFCCSNTEIYITDRHSWCWPFSSGLQNCDKPHALSAGRCEVCPFCMLLRTSPCLELCTLYWCLGCILSRGGLHISPESWAVNALVLWALGCLVWCVVCWDIFCGFFFFLSDTILFLARILHDESGGE